LPFPNFLIIGAAKAGTTALYTFLGQHPQVFMSPNKEPRFFSFAGQELDPDNPVHKTTVTELSEYLKLFDGAGDATAIGEASPSYLHNPDAPQRIKEMIPDAKLVAILRNPADRAFSHFMHFIKQGYETTEDFDEALGAVDELSRGDWFPRRHYLSFGFYGEQLARYYERFDRSQIKVYIHEEFRQAPLDTLKDLFRFLGVDSENSIDTSLKVNVSGIPLNRTLHDWLTKKSTVRHLLGHFLPEKTRRRIMSKVEMANLKRSTLPVESRHKMMDLYRQDILCLEELLQRKLDCWSA
jgi:hypothetical protein